MNNYELAVIYDPGLELDLDKATGKVEKIIVGAGGKITNTDNWGKRKLAYPINKQDYGIYVFYSLEMPGSGPREVEQTLNITDEVIRFLITRPDLEAAAKAEAERTEKQRKAAERGDEDEPEAEETDDKKSTIKA